MSIGKPGATVNLSERGVRGTVGLPGTGLSYSEQFKREELPGEDMQPASRVGRWLLVIVAPTTHIANCWYFRWHFSLRPQGDQASMRATARFSIPVEASTSTRAPRPG